MLLLELLVLNHSVDDELYASLGLHCKIEMEPIEPPCLDGYDSSIPQC